MGVPDFTTVVGVDAKHLEQLGMVWQTWKRHKPSLLDHPMIVFRNDLADADVRAAVDHPNLETCVWPMGGATYAGDDKGKWTNPRRHMMLAGFVHVPALFVKTPYWLKIDTDAIATGVDDWIDIGNGTDSSGWFADGPAFIGSPWSFTKPPDQMTKLDRWVEENKDNLMVKGLLQHPPLNLVPKPDARRLRHQRTVSWCAFFRTDFTIQCALMASETCGPFQIPVPSQDGYLWYVAKRAGLGIVRANMKRRGWMIRSSMRSIKQAATDAMATGLEK